MFQTSLGSLQMQVYIYIYLQHSGGPSNTMKTLLKFVPRGGEEKVRKTYIFLLGSALGSPGPLQVTKMDPKGAKMLPRDPHIEILGSKTAYRMCAISCYFLPSGFWFVIARWRSWASATRIYIYMYIYVYIWIYVLPPTIAHIMLGVPKKLCWLCWDLVP